MANFYMLIGLPGSGKSTWIEHNETELSTVTISSDSIREQVFGDVNDQTHNAEVFELMKTKTHENLRNNINVIYDATNTSRKRRTQFLKELPEGIHKIAILFTTPFNICCDRNNKRDRQVPMESMLKFYKGFQAPWYTEGFDEILLVADKDLSIKAYEELLNTYNESLNIPHDNPHHTNTLGEHMREAHEYAKKVCKREHLNLIDSYILTESALWHDIGKSKVKTFIDNKGETTQIAHYYNHASVSAYDYLCAMSGIVEEELFDMLKTKCKDWILFITNLINTHMIFYSPDTAINNMKTKFGDKFWKMLELLHECDTQAH